MAGAVEFAVDHLGDHRAQKMRALLVVGDEMLLAEAREHARGAPRGVLKELRFAHRQLVDRRDRLGARPRGAPVKEAFDHQRELPGDEACAGETDKFYQVAPRDIFVLGPINGEILSPLRLVLGGAPVGRHGYLVTVGGIHRLTSSRCKEVEYHFKKWHRAGISCSSEYRRSPRGSPRCD